MSELAFIRPTIPQSFSLLWNESWPLSLTFPNERLTKSCSSTLERKLLTSCPQCLYPLVCFALLQLLCPFGLPMSPWFGLGLHLDLSISVRLFASSPAFLSQCFFPGPWHVLCAALLPLNIQPSHTLPGPAHFHALGECRCKELPKRSLSSPDHCPYLLFPVCSSPHSQPHFLPSKPCLPGSIPGAGSGCQAVPVILPVSLLFPSTCQLSLQHPPVGSQIAPTTVVSSSMARLPKCMVLTATPSCFSGHTDKSFPCRTGTEVVAADRCWNNSFSSLCSSLFVSSRGALLLHFHWVNSLFHKVFAFQTIYFLILIYCLGP